MNTSPTTFFFLLFLFVPILPASEPPKTERTSVQIVNATSVPRLEVRVNGRVFYPNFRQGLYTADSPIELSRVEYQFKDLASGLVAEREVRFRPRNNVTLLITGDFSTEYPADQLPGATNIEPEAQGTFQPNLQTIILDHALPESESPIRYRVINAMPKTSMEISAPNEAKRTLRPGQSVSYSGKPAFWQFQVLVDGESIPVTMNQEEVLRNATIVFYLSEGKPKFTRVFENLYAPTVFDVEESDNG